MGIDGSIDAGPRVPSATPRTPRGLDTGGSHAVIEFRRLAPELEGGLWDLFEALKANGDEGSFHPHPLTREEAGYRCSYTGHDLFYAATCSGEVVGYGMLRGWDEGYAIPSLGIAVSPTYRGKGLARPFMVFLHAAARLRGAPAVRLKVYVSNVTARELYRTLGYQYERLDEEQLLGRLDLPSRGERPPRRLGSL
jgi:[ribosomal protein S18]-alanine N-acetyltransferase